MLLKRAARKVINLLSPDSTIRVAGSVVYRALREIPVRFRNAKIVTKQQEQERQNALIAEMESSVIEAEVEVEVEVEVEEEPSIVEAETVVVETIVSEYESWLAENVPTYLLPAESSTKLALHVFRPICESPDMSAELSSEVEPTCHVAEVETQEWSQYEKFLADRDRLLKDGRLHFVLILRDGDKISQHLPALLHEATASNPGIDIVTFDSDRGESDGRRYDPLFRPQFSPDMLRGVNYVQNAFAFRLECADQLDFSQSVERELWRMLLHAELTGAEFHHISVPLLTAQTAYPDLTQEDAVMVQTAMHQHGVKAEVLLRESSLRIRYAHEGDPRVSIIIPTKHNRHNMIRLLQSLAETRYSNFEICIVDNGGETEDNRNWYEQVLTSFDAEVLWWTESPFNYNRANNAGVASSSGSIIVLLNDDTEIVDPDWLSDMVGIAIQPGVGTVGLQLLEGTGLIQHGGVILGPGGLADNLFSCMTPDQMTMIGHTSWYRNTLAVTGACVALRRDFFEQVGGLDERFQLMGSDVVLGLDQIIRGRRNVVIPFDMVRHFESLTRGDTVPEQDLYASYWRYVPWLTNGDPFVSPNISSLSAKPMLRSKDERRPNEVILAGFNRPTSPRVQTMSIAEEARALLGVADVTDADADAVKAHHELYLEKFTVRTINWFIPEIDMPFFGGFNTCFRLADMLARKHGVHNRFVVLGNPDENFFRSALDAAFAGLGTNASIAFYNGSPEQLAQIPAADVAVATLWLTAIHVARLQNVKRHFYMVQDFEPEFYPASSMFAMAEESYRLGLYALCNTESMYRTYTEAYGGKGLCFIPAVDREIYHASGRVERHPDEPVTIFAYARDHFRNCWELVYGALNEIKKKYGTRVRVVVAGASHLPSSSDFVDLGLMDYRATANLYRQADIGVTMQISRHPSYLPLELMACGVSMVVPDSEWFDWIFEDGENSLRTRRSVSSLVSAISALIDDPGLRARIGASAVATIEQHHGDWSQSFEGIFNFLCDPENTDQIS